MQPTSHDVAIVGGSIAGCTAAVLFARRGLKVVVLERHADPAAYKKICTHYIQASATPTIERLGLSKALEDAGAVPNGFELWTRWGWIRAPAEGAGRFPAHGYNIRREKLDPMLRRLATATPGVELRCGHKVERLVEDQGAAPAVVTHTADGRTHELRARLVVGADGRQSTVAQLAGLAARTKPHGRFAYFAHYRNLPLRSGTASQMWFLEPDIAYAFPNDDGITVLATMPGTARLPEFKADLEGSFQRMFERLPDGPAIAAGERVSPIMGQVEMPNVVRRPCGRSVALIGDAALAADPLWGVGCGWALQSADWVVEATADALREGAPLAPALARYRRRHRQALAGHEFLISDFSTGRAYNPIERLMYSAAARDPAAARDLVDFGARHIRVREFLAPSALARAAWVNLRHLAKGRRATPAGGPPHARDAVRLPH